jgi:hypothetical protein
MNNVISEYQKWKQQGKDLRAQAKHAMESRFAELLSEAVQIAEEYRADFGGHLKPPSSVTAFRYKAGIKAKAKKAANPKPAVAKAAAPKAAPLPLPVQAAAKPDRKIAGLQKQLVTVNKKLEAAKAASAPTRNLEDRIYEIEDALRLARED